MIHVDLHVLTFLCLLFPGRIITIKIRANWRNSLQWSTTPTMLGITCCVRFHTVICCCMFFGVAARSLKLVKVLSQQLPTCLLFRDQDNVRSVSTTLPKLLGPHQCIMCVFVPQCVFDHQLLHDVVEFTPLLSFRRLLNVFEQAPGSC